MFSRSKKFGFVIIALVAIALAIPSGILGFLAYAAFITVPLTGLTIFAYLRWFQKKPRPAFSVAVSLKCLGFPASMLVCYAFYLVSYRVYSHDPSYQNFLNTVRITTYNVVISIIFIQLLTSLLLSIYAPKGTRFLLGTILAWELILSAWVGFVITMGIAGIYF